MDADIVRRLPRRALSDTDFVLVIGQSGLATVNASELGGSQESESLLQSASVELTDAQIKALPTTGVTIVAAPGSGKIIVPVVATLLFTRTADYTNIQATAVIKIQNTDGNKGIAPLNESFGLVSGLLAGGSSNFTSIGPYGFVDVDNTENLSGTIAIPSEFENLGYQIKATNAAGGDFTGGNAANTLAVTLYYVVQDV